MIRHHPAEASLIACAAGTMAMAHARVIEVHAARCPVCAAGLRAAEVAGGALLDALPPAPMPPDALARALARLETAAPEPAPAAPAFDLAALASGRWRRVAPGIAIMNLLSRDATDSRLDLIRVAPGRALLTHGHTGAETTCVLSGAFADGTGTFAAGDCVEADAALDHTPRALPGEDCVCLIATTHHLRPHGWLGRLVRPLLGM
ncbi:MAG: ChrR family anti-sigma-E factor [Rhodospirillales bacterium]|nr:ChrR family anti-sigma-E factor [Rhodospirillales bacterium]MDE2575369.1 ChrR family anti-sigma-E factor [Rhodospirillales bacterium]